MQLSRQAAHLRRLIAWSGAWRERLALKCAASAIRLSGRGEDEAALRDAWLLRASDEGAGPAGDVFHAFRKLAGRPLAINAELVRELAGLLGLRLDGALDEVAGLVDELGQSNRAAPFIAAEMAIRVCALRPDAEALAWWFADWALAAKLRWRRPVPLMMAERYGAAFRISGGRGRLKPGEDGFSRAVCLALVNAAGESLRIATQISRRAERLLAVAPKLRTKGADAVIRQLLEHDALPVSAPGANLSRWASRRLFERMQQLEAVRELSGRASFRIYGL